MNMIVGILVVVLVVVGIVALVKSSIRRNEVKLPDENNSPRYLDGYGPTYFNPKRKLVIRMTIPGRKNDKAMARKVAR
jgi:hypothetical protein